MCVWAGAGVRLCVAVLSESLYAVAVTLTVFGGWGRCGCTSRAVSATQRTPSLSDCTAAVTRRASVPPSRGAPLTKLQQHHQFGRTKGVVSVSHVPTRMSFETHGAVRAGILETAVPPTGTQGTARRSVSPLILTRVP